MTALTFSNLSSDTFEEESQKKAGRKRPRVREAVSCWQCRSRKIRCDREQPCRPCVERNAGGKCTYSQPKSTAQSTTPATAAAAPLPGRPRPQKTTPAARPPLSAAGPAAPTPARLSTRAASSQSPPSGSPHASSQPVHQRHGFQGASRKTRLVAVSHWMTPCNEMLVVRALVTRSKEFESSLARFAEIKASLQLRNARPVCLPADPARADGRPSASVLFSFLPDRQSCEQWIGRYFHSYHRIFPMVDPPTLAADLDQAFSAPSDAQFESATAVNSVYIMRLLVVVALGMQLSDDRRLHGRRLGGLVEEYVHRAARVQKPCTGSVQVLLLLLLLKTITSSDTDGEHSSMDLLGLTSHVVSSMGLHRDPALFGVPPYYAAQRTTLWACFLRLHLAYCIRTGTQLPVRLEDSDCPLPMPDRLRTPPTNPALMTESVQACARGWALDDIDAQRDASFALASARLAAVVAPVHQAMCSAKPWVTPEQLATLQGGFAALVSDLPAALQPGTGGTAADPITELQRTMLSVGMHSCMLILAFSSLFGKMHGPAPGTHPGAAAEVPAAEVSAAEAYSAQRPQLLEIWDYTVSILHQFQNVCRLAEAGTSASSSPSVPSVHARSETVEAMEAANDASAMAHHLLWTDAGRAALGACLVVGRLRRQDLDRTMPFSVRPQQQHTASVFQQMLAQSLSGLLQLWRSRCHLGPVTAKASLLLAVTVAVTTSLYSDFTGIFGKGVAAADALIADMQRDLEQRQSECALGAGLLDLSVSTAGLGNTTVAHQFLAASSAPPSQPPSASGPVGLASPDMQPLNPFCAWGASNFFDAEAQQPPHLTRTSSTASKSTTPDFGGVGSSIGGGGGSGGACDEHSASNDSLGLQFASDLGYHFGLSTGFDSSCPLAGEFEKFDASFMEFSGDSIMSMF